MKRLASIIVVLFVLAAGVVSAQPNDDHLTKAVNHYVDGVTSAVKSYENCITSIGTTSSRWIVNSYSADQLDLLGDISNNVEDVHFQAEVLLCELQFNSRMTQLQIEVQLILAGIDRDILNAISR